MEKYRPIIISHAVPENGDIVFLKQDCRLRLKGRYVENVWKILKHCSGYNTISEISENTDLDKGFVEKIIHELQDEGILIDACQQYRHFHQISSNPQSFLTNLTREEVKQHQASSRGNWKKGAVIDFKKDLTSALYSIQTGRHSCRWFDDKKALSIDQIGNICNYAYSLSRHAVPSGGALYPLRIYCIISRPQVGADVGYYEYDNENEYFIRYNDCPDKEQLKYCFNDESLAYNSGVQIVISADLNRQPYKYSNHGYRLTLIEVGQAAQNISLYCEENGIATCELGGILDDALATEMGIKEDGFSPILGIAIGYPSSRSGLKYSELLEKLEKEFVGENKIVADYGTTVFGTQESSFYGAWAHFHVGKERTAGATGSSYYESACKAIIEAYERYRSSQTRIDYRGTVLDDRFFLLPEELAPLSSEQSTRFGLESQQDPKKRPINWTKDMTGEYYIPTDYVYYGHKDKNKIIFSTSSGVAAYTDYENAKKRALAEIIERDAIMRSWYQQDSPCHVDDFSIPVHILKRRKYWNSKGRAVHVLQMKSLLVPAFLVVIVSDKYPCFVSGAAVSFDNADEAMNKAFNEAEYNLLLALHKPIDSPPDINAIKHPIDHGQYYHFKDNMEKIKWVWENSTTTSVINKNYDINDIISKLEVKFVDLSEAPDSFIKVVRAVSKKTIPISFGYKNDYYLHPEVKELRISKNVHELPIYFA